MNVFLYRHSATLRIVGIYLLVGCLWIYTSDTILDWLVRDQQILVKIAIYKGSFYVIFTSLLLYFLINRYSRNLADSEQALKDQVKSLLESETNLKQAETALLNIRRLHEATEKIGKVGGWEFDTETLEQTWTNEVYRIHEVDLSYKPTVDDGINFYTPESSSVIEQAVQRAIEHGEPFDVELEIITGKKNTKTVHVVGRADREKHKVSGFFQDITDRKKTEEALDKMQYLMSEGQKIAHLGTFEYVVDTKTMVWSEEEYRIYGFNPEEPSPKYDVMLAKNIHPDDADLLHQAFTAAIQSGSVYELEHRIVRPDGSVRWVHDLAHPYFDQNGKLLRYVGTTLDITDRKIAEESLKLTRFSIDNSSDGLFWMTPDARIIDVNVAACCSLGYSREELLQLSIPDIDSLCNADVWRHIFTELQQKGTLTFETEYLTKDSKRFPVEIVSNLIQFGSKELIFALVRNIADRKMAEQALQDERDLSMDIINAQPAGVYRIRVFAPETWKNDAWRNSKNSPHVVELTSGPFCKILGTTKEAFENNPGMIIDLIYPDDREGFAKKNEEAAVLLEEFNWEGRLLIDGVIRWVRFQSLPRPLENGDVLWTGALTDISELKKAEEEKQLLEHQFQQTQKLESLGVLSGGIAHDFNNILAIIMGNCSLAKMDEENAQKYIPEIEKASERAAELCRQMLAYAGKAQSVQANVNFRSLVDEMVNMLKKTIPQNAEIKFDCSTDISCFQGDGSQLSQVVMNLIINASEAIGKEHGEISVSLAETTISEVHPEKDYNGKVIPLGNYVCLEVTDNGCGMDEKTKWRIFEPFYTTKFTGRGLGMSAVLGIIKSHKGALQLHSQFGQGTTFKVYLPVQKKYSTEVEDHELPAPLAPWQGSGTILLVEDEDQVRLIAKALLKKIGFSVLGAANGKEALELYQRNATNISLVMTDMGMPIMDGYELFYELKKLNPELPIIVSSGYGDFEVSSRIDKDDIAGLISKPYGPDKLREVLKFALEGLQ